MVSSVVDEEVSTESVHQGSNSGNSSTSSRFRLIVEGVNRNSQCRCFLWFLAFLCALTVVFMLAAYDSVVEKVAVGQMVLQEGGEKFKAWKKPIVPIIYRVYIFNLTNPQEFMDGARPRVRECGPYVYLMSEDKLDIKFNGNGTVTYRTKPVYVFSPYMSTGSENDVIWSVNIPFINMADATKDSAIMNLFVQVVQKIHGFETLRRLSVKELLWGHRSRVMDWARGIQTLPYPHLHFGLMVGFNNTAQEPYSIYTGEKDSSNMNRIHSWNGQTKLDFWTGEHCNAIKGTDAGGFHPNVEKDEILFIFNGQFCRSIPLVYNSSVNHAGIEAYRFTPPSDVFSYGPKKPENSCFCSSYGCPPEGVLDLKPCYWGAAVAFSFPHFYQADPKLTHIVRGLR